MPKSETWMFYRGNGKKDEDNLAAICITAEKIKAVPLSQFIDLRDAKDETFATITFPSTVKIRRVGA